MSNSQLGKNAKVTVGTGDSTISLLGTWSLSGMSQDQLEDTAFGQTYKTYKMGLLDGGTISFSGLYDPADTNGQDILRTANENGTLLTSIKFWINSASYYTPAYTAITGSGVYVTSWEIGADRSALMTASFSCKVTGGMTRV